MPVFSMMISKKKKRRRRLVLKPSWDFLNDFAIDQYYSFPGVRDYREENLEEVDIWVTLDMPFTCLFHETLDLL
jgi:hypothetical protein